MFSKNSILQTSFRSRFDVSPAQAAKLKIVSLGISFGLGLWAVGWQARSHQNSDLNSESDAIHPVVFEETSQAADATPGPATNRLSMSSCASCHGSAAFLDPDEPKDQWKSAYQIWASRDPHSRAYNTLWNRQSRQIVAALVMGTTGKTSATRDPIEDGSQYQQTINQYCVACHSSVPAEISTEMVGQRTDGWRDANLSMADGVNCHSCHSLNRLDDPAGNRWVVAHTMESWNHEGVEKKSQGLRELATASDRAETCVQCHVGSPGRDVNHDLIAAGHPRMVFEYASFMDRLPKHWPENRAKDYHTNGWSIGQQISAKATVALLQHRAQLAIEKRGPWPEFAEYRCENCHHGLGGLWYQPNENYLAGLPAWGSWSLPSGMPDELGGDQAETIRKVMAQSFPPPETIAEVTRTFSASFPQLTPREHLLKYVQRLPQLNSTEVFAWYLAVNSCVQDFFPPNDPNRQNAIRHMIELKSLLDRSISDSVSGRPIRAAELQQKITQLQQLILPVLQQPAEPTGLQP